MPGATAHIRIPPIPEVLRERLKIGTCSWKFPAWRGLLYPPDFDPKREEWLVPYSRALNSVEIDQWFWSLFPGGIKLPDPATARRYAEAVPADFRFSVKAPNSLTLTHHYSLPSQRELAGKPNPRFLDPALLGDFLAALEPLGAKLGPVMLQFEYLSRAKVPGLPAFLDRLAAFFDRAPQGPLYAVETRNPDYLRREYFDFLRSRGVGFVLLEGHRMPHADVLHRDFDIFTAGFTVIRLHQSPNAGEPPSKAFDRIVNPQARGLHAAVAICQDNWEAGRTTYLNFDNGYEGSAPLSIARFLEALERG